MFAELMTIFGEGFTIRPEFHVFRIPHLTSLVSKEENKMGQGNRADSSLHNSVTPRGVT